MAPTPSKAKSKSKRFLGFEVHKPPHLEGVWINIEDAPFICIAHRKTWMVTVTIEGHKFEAEGPTEAQARSNFMSKLSDLRSTLGTIEAWSKRR
jgi:acetylornithine deacetylase/succinyl-diaminopimelate desuccinylase-like protein